MRSPQLSFVWVFICVTWTAVGQRWEKYGFSTVDIVDGGKSQKMSLGFRPILKIPLSFTFLFLIRSSPVKLPFCSFVLKGLLVWRNFIIRIVSIGNL